MDKNTRSEDAMPSMREPRDKRGGSVGIPVADQGHSGTDKRQALSAGDADLQEVSVSLFREHGGHYKTPDKLKLGCPNCGHRLV